MSFTLESSVIGSITVNIGGLGVALLPVALFLVKKPCVEGNMFIWLIISNSLLYSSLGFSYDIEGLYEYSPAHANRERKNPLFNCSPGDRVEVVWSAETTLQIKGLLGSSFSLFFTGVGEGVKSLGGTRGASSQLRTTAVEFPKRVTIESRRRDCVSTPGTTPGCVETPWRTTKRALFDLVEQEGDVLTVYYRPFVDLPAERCAFKRVPTMTAEGVFF